MLVPELRSEKYTNCMQSWKRRSPHSTLQQDKAHHTAHCSNARKDCDSKSVTVNYMCVQGGETLTRWNIPFSLLTPPNKAYVSPRYTEEKSRRQAKQSATHKMLVSNDLEEKCRRTLEKETVNSCQNRQ